MRRIFLTLLGLIVLTTAGAPLTLSFYLPSYAEEKTIEYLYAVGFKTTAIQKTETSMDTVLLQNIKLDDKGFSTAKSIKAEYSWFGFFTGNLIHSLSIEGLTLTGELTRNQKLSIAGWNRGNVSDQNMSSIKTINIQDGKLDLMLEGIGGINIKYNIQLRQTALNNLEFKGTMSGTQRLFSTDAKINGTIKKSGLWQASLEIDQGKVDLPALKATRVSGNANISGGDNRPMEFMMQLSAGGMTFFDLPWHSISATVEGNTERYTILSEGKSVGQEGIEFTLNLPNGLTFDNLSGSVHTQKPSDLFSYLKTNNLITQDTDYPSILDYIGALSLDFETRIHEQSSALTDVNYRIKDENGIIDVEGNGQIDNEKKIIKGNLAMPSALLSGTPEGRLLVNGEFDAHFTDDNIKASGFVSASLKDAALKLGPFNLKNINTTLSFDDLSSFSTKKKQKISFSLPIASAIKQSGTANILVQNGDNILIDNVKIELFDGNILSTPVRLVNNSNLQNFLLTLSNMNLEMIGKSLNINGLSLNGSLQGSLPVKINNGEASIEDGVLNNIGPGIIKFKPSEIPVLLQGDDLYLETARMALENYHYDFFEIRISGPIAKSVTLTINAKGHNPDLFEKRPFALNLSTNLSLNEIFSKILEEQQP